MASFSEYKIATNSLSSKFNPIEEAWFDKSKKEQLFTNWKRRYFSLDMANKKLSYYVDQDKVQWKGSIFLSDASTIRVSESSGAFVHIIEVSGVAEGKGDAVLVMSADSLESRDKWAAAITECAHGVEVHQPDLTSDVFYNSIPLTVTFETEDGIKVVANDGSLILPEATVKPPTVTWNAAHDSKFTLIMTDLDAPAVADPAFKEFVHWVVVNIPGNNIEGGEKVLSYLGAGPPYNGGEHRYLFLLFKQKQQMSAVQTADATEYFNSRGKLRPCEWALSPGVGLGVPVGFNGFFAGWSPYVDTIHEKVGFMPPEEFRSPDQKLKFAAEQMAKLQLEDAAKAGQSLSTAIHPTLKYGIDTKAVFDGCTVNKRFSSEMINQKRFVWIDDAMKRFYWSKTSAKDSAAKFLSIAEDVTAIELKKNKISFTHKAGKKESVEIEIVGTMNDQAQAADWHKVAMDIFSKK